jgi:hypothetical protein
VKRFKGRVWRHVPSGAEPLHLGWILKAARGRWNQVKPRRPCLYTSLTPDGALAELHRHTSEYFASLRRDFVSLDVEVGPVLDLTNAQVRRRVDVPYAALPGTVNLMIYVERTGGIRILTNGPDRITLAPL